MFDSDRLRSHPGGLRRAPVFSRLRTSAFVATGFILVLVLLRSVVRRTWVADALFVVLLSSLFSALAESPAVLPVMVLGFASYIWILRRFGLLAWVALAWAKHAVHDLPLAVTSWYAALSLTTPLVTASRPPAPVA